MLLSKLLLSFRNLWREKFFSALNILGFATALTCFAFIALWIWDEWQRDRYFPNAERIVRIASRVSTETSTQERAGAGLLLGPTLKNDYPEVENFVRFNPGDAVVKSKREQFVENLLTADASFFEVFNYGLSRGDVRTALKDPYSVVLSQPLARKYFGKEDPIGKTLTILGYDPSGFGESYRVTGVMAENARPSHFSFDMLISFSTYLQYYPDAIRDKGWGDSDYYTYLLLKPEAEREALQAKLPAFYQKYVAPLQPKDGAKNETVYTLQALSDIYLHSQLSDEISENGDMRKLYLFGTIGLLILLIASINYINLTTARAMKYAKNVGVRKTLGAQRGQLVTLFLSESVLTVLLAVGLALVLALLGQPLFEQVTGKPLGVFNLPYLPWFLPLIVLGFGALAGVYPALVLSGFRPVQVLKGNLAFSRGQSGGLSLRKALVTLQFAVSIALIFIVLVMYQQMLFVQNKNLGYEKEALIALKVNGDQAVKNGIEAFRNDLCAQQALVRGMAYTTSLPIGGVDARDINTVDEQGEKIVRQVAEFKTDYHYADVLGLNFLAGRNFSTQFPTDFPSDSTRNYILNEAAVKAFGWANPAWAIGKAFEMEGLKGQVVGVVQDFHFNSLKHAVEPLAMSLAGNGRAQSLLLKINLEKTTQAVAHINDIWKIHFPDAFLDFSFVDDRLDAQYRAELRFGTLFLVFSLFSIFLACLGLFGLSAYTAEQRTKEIGVRKVLGASVASITTLLTQDYLKLVLLAFVLTAPLSWYLMNQWLADFAYRIEIQGWMFVVAVLAAAGIAFLAVGVQSVKAALANPVKSLRSE